MLELPTEPTRSGKRQSSRWELEHPHDEERVIAAMVALMWRYGHECVVRRRPSERGLFVDEMSLTGAEALKDVLDVVPLTDVVSPHLPVVLFGGSGVDADIDLTVDDSVVTVRHDPSMYDVATIEQMGQHLQQLLLAPNVGIADVNLMSERERRLVLETWNGHTNDHGRPLLLHTLFEEQAERTPNAIALEFEGQELSYGQLNERANRVANWLVAEGVVAETAVGVHAERSIEFFVCLLAILKSGGAFVHLDSMLPDARLAWIYDKTGALLMFVDEANSGAEFHDGRRCVSIEQIDVITRTQPTKYPEVAIDPETTAYIQFTSGSTGEPKGVLRPHRMTANAILTEQLDYPLFETDRVLLKLPVAQREFIWPLAHGGRCVIARPGGERDDRYLTELIRDRGITAASIIPSVLAVLVRSSNMQECTSLRHLFVGGETLSTALEAELRQKLHAEIHYTLALSEADYVCTRPGEAPADSNVPVVGKPHDARIYLCDPRGNLVPPGIAGEIHIGGPSLSNGYLGRHDLNSEKFLLDPWSTTAGARMFRTGDLGRFRHDGQIEYRGRRDHQVKVRGQRLEPVEVELALREHPAVNNVAVIGWPDPQQGSRLVAYIVPTPTPAAPDQLRAYLAERLPSFMVPSAFVFLDRLPQLPTGKLDRAALPRGESARPALDEPFIGPRTPLEAAIVDIWKDVLQVPEVGINDPFLALGGDSLRVLVVRAGLEQALERSVAISDLLERDTVAKIAAFIEQTMATGQHTGSGKDDRRAMALAARTDRRLRRTDR